MRKTIQAVAAAALALFAAPALAHTHDVTAPAPLVQWVTGVHPQGDVFDATDETFYLRHSSNPDPAGACNYSGTGALPVQRYPIQNPGTSTTGTPFGTQDARWIGGRVIGEVSITGDGSIMGYCNSAGIEFKSNISTAQVIERVRIDRVWDGIRVNMDPCKNAPGTCQQTVRQVWITNARDDAIENDGMGGLLVDDSLLDGVFSGISATPGTCSTCPPSHRLTDTITLRDSLLRLRGFPYTSTGLGGYQPKYHVAPFKIDATLGPGIVIENSVIAAEFYMSSVGYAHWNNFFAHVDSCTGSEFLWLSDTAFPPASFPPLPSWWASCFTVLTGTAAWESWNNARTQWIMDHPLVERMAWDPQ